MAIHPKVTAGLVAGAITGLLVAEAKRRGFPIEPDEAADITVLLSFAAGYFVVDGNGNGASEVPALIPAPVAPPPAPIPGIAPPPPVPQPPAPAL